MTNDKKRYRALLDASMHWPTNPASKAVLQSSRGVLSSTSRNARLNLFT